MDLHHRPSTAELTAELDGTARRALDARVPFASRKEVERYSQLLPNLYDDRGPIEYPATRISRQRTSKISRQSKAVRLRRTALLALLPGGCGTTLIY